MEHKFELSNIDLDKVKNNKEAVHVLGFGIFSYMLLRGFEYMIDSLYNNKQKGDIDQQTDLLQ